MARDITPEERELAGQMLERARAAMAEVADYDQARVDRLAQAVGWALGNESTFTRLAEMAVDESGAGDRVGRPNKRFKLHGILRDALRQPSVGIIEEDHERGLVKYAKPAGVIASLVPMTNPVLTPPGHCDQCDQSSRCSHLLATPADQGDLERGGPDHERRAGARGSSGRPVAVRREAFNPHRPGVDGDLRHDHRHRGPAMVKAAYSSGKPAFGVGAGNSTIVIDETADIEEAARNTRMSKTSDFGSGCSADGNVSDRRSHL